MLKPFIKISNHSIEKLHQLNKKLVDVLINADQSDIFDYNTFDTDFKAFIDSEKNQKKNDYLYKPIFEIFELVKGKKVIQDKIKLAFKVNNDIEALCNKSSSTPYYYDDFKKKAIQTQFGNTLANELGDNLGNILKSFYEDLYNHVFNRATFKKTFNTDLKKYYQELKKESKLKICPFCGILPFKTDFENVREAFDHYFPKAKYPFSSVNIENLYPMCNTCNSSNKGANEVIYINNKRKNTNRRKAFYPFDNSISYSNLQISMSFLNSTYNLRDLKEIDFKLEINNDVLKEEIIQWKTVFGIEKRYKGQIAENTDDWMEFIETYFDEHKDKYSTNKIIQQFIKLLNKQPLQDKNFLKATYFESIINNGFLTKILEKRR